MNKISSLNKRIIIQKLEEEASSLHGIEENWQDYLEIWASVKPINTLKWHNEIIAGLHHMSRNFLQITIRYNENINHKMRILYKNKIFIIHKITSVEEKDQFFEIIAEEKRQEGDNV